jgi:hypothetical protein
MPSLLPMTEVRIPRYDPNDEPHQFRTRNDPREAQ